MRVLVSHAATRITLLIFRRMSGVYVPVLPQLVLLRMPPAIPRIRAMVTRI